MNMLVRLLVLTVFFWAAIALKRDHVNLGSMQEQFQEIHDLCKDVTGATEEMMDQFEKGNFIEDVKMKRFTLCLWRATKLMDTNHNLHPGIFQSIVPDSLEETPLIKNAKKCIAFGLNSDHEEYYDKVYEVSKCLYKADPDNFFVL